MAKLTRRTPTCRAARNAVMTNARRIAILECPACGASIEFEISDDDLFQVVQCIECGAVSDYDGADLVRCDPGAKR